MSGYLQAMLMLLDKAQMQSIWSMKFQMRFRILITYSHFFLYKPGGGLTLQYVDVVFKPIASGGEFSSYIDDNGLEWRVHKFTAVNFAGAYHNGVNPEPTVQNFIVNTDIKARFLIVGGGARGGDPTTASTIVINGNSGPQQKTAQEPLERDQRGKS
jgi:hypothetical protein